ncbi:hypothetical protein PIB30_096471, partial [Stylosanthes scabra]|nr:hypothetical protein [Stylosanthes scabra]
FLIKQCVKNGRPKRVTREESIREEEEKIQLQLDDPISQEELEEQYERVSKKFFLEKMYPYPLMAMKHYNKNRRKEEQFEVTEDVTGVCLKHGNVGFFHSLHFRARPKRVGKILQNSSDEVDFFALLHMMPNDDTTHVCYCMRNPDSNPPDPHAPLSQYIPLRCEVCGIPENQGKSRGPECSTR